MSRRSLTLGVLVPAMLVAAHVMAAAQSLADVARKEQERRRAVTTPSKVYTNEDLAGAPPISVAGSAPAASAAEPSKGTDQTSGTPTRTPPTAGTGAANPNAGAGAARDEKYWRTRLAETRANLARQELFLEALQSRINGLTTDFVARDDPQQRGVLATDRLKALVEMERVRTDIQRLKTEIVEIEEDARRSGAPAGWLR